MCDNFEMYPHVIPNDSSVEAVQTDKRLSNSTDLVFSEVHVSCLVILTQLMAKLHWLLHVF